MTREKHEALRDRARMEEFMPAEWKADDAPVKAPVTPRRATRIGPFVMSIRPILFALLLQALVIALVVLLWRLW